MTRWSSALLLLLACGGPWAVGQDFLPARATPWTTSQIHGSPEPPLPYTTSRVFRQVRLNQPTDIVWLPAARRWVATQVDGKIFTFENDSASAVCQPLLDLNQFHDRPVFRGFAIAFHPDQTNQPWCYVTYSSKQKHPQGAHLVRFKVIDPRLPKIDPASRVELASWNSAGHAGSCMRFGPDGFLYVSVGDGQPPYPPDPLNTGQDLSDLESSILRIDVNDPTQEQLYRIPVDNPFYGLPNTRGEIWAFGFRNPWKMAFNPTNGDLFVGDVGWEMREMIYRVKRGANYGWSIMEGSQPVKQGLQPKLPITAPIFEHTHIDSRSITGGFFWHSSRLPELQGAYVYGDWMTGKVWALKTEGDRVLWQKELVDTPIAIICFMLDPSGEVLLVGYDGTILRLEENAQPVGGQDFPKRLSGTGLFRDVAGQQPESGVLEYEISAHHWADGTHSRQWIAIPGSLRLGLWENPSWETGQVHGRFKFPRDTVLAKTVSYLAEAGNPDSQRHLETQILHLLDDEWRAYNYIWNDEQTDALLQDDIALESKLSIKDPDAVGGVRRQTWHHSSRSECLLCHIWSAGTVHGFIPEQLNFEWLGEIQLDRFRQQGLFETRVLPSESIPSPHDASKSLEDRARAYLALNCSSCHRPQGGGTANFNFDITKPLSVNNYVDAPAAQGDFGIRDARVLAPGDPFRSLLLYRLLKSGRGHMPQFGSSLLDREGIQLLHQWIDSMPSSSSPRAVDWSKLINRLQQDSSDAVLQSMLGTMSQAMALSYACCRSDVNQELRSRIVGQGSAHADPQIRDLFEGFLPEDQRTERLGPSIDQATLLALEGSAERGKMLFENAPDVNCRLCHRIGSTGQAVGSALSGIGMQQTPAEILNSIIQPSEKIDPKYRARNVLTVDGNVLTGVLVSEDDAQLVLSDSQGRMHTVARDDIEQMQAAMKSIMPEMLLSGMTAQQAADLLAFLSAQREIGPLQHKRTQIRRATQSLKIDGRSDEAAWQNASPMGDFVFTWWNEGDGLRQPTEARMLWDDNYLYVHFYCHDKDILATRTERDSDVYRDDCVEVFASPELEHPQNYFNLEMNALGTQLDNYRPQGRNPETAWNPEGIRIAVEVDGTLNDTGDVDQGWSLEVAIPFKLFEHVLPEGRPQAGDRWRLNLNRLEDNMAIKSQWSQGDRNIPRFHTPELFGFVEFVQ